jgi:hypothetical protein
LYFWQIIHVTEKNLQDKGSVCDDGDLFFPLVAPNEDEDIE